uniref:Uncharacterized protein n=1 Tax=viral metagenome TaxID=1070528 RepID=A0A6M3K899_9ZZZZ
MAENGDVKIIYEWELPKDHPNFSGHDDLPEAYRVIESEKAAGGIIVYAKYHGEWEANPWNTRTLIRQLLAELKEAMFISKELLKVIKKDLHR